jgi:cell division protein FtsI (penicillin-binding protein 3)
MSIKNKLNSNLFSTEETLKQKRFSYIKFIYLFSFTFVFLRILMLQIFPPSKKELAQIASHQYTQTMKSATNRGSLFDRKDRPLALSIRLPSLTVNPHTFNPSKKKIKTLSKILQIPSTKIKQLSQKNSYFAWLKRKIPYQQEKKILSLNIVGISSILEPARYYPGGRTISNLLGLVGTDNTGLLGLEQTLNKQLSRTQKQSTQFKDAKGNSIITTTNNSPTSGDDITLTLDLAIQEIAYEALLKGIKNSKAKKGYALLADPHSGKILAIANYPSFNPNDTSNLNMQNTKNLASSYGIEPGSVLKTIFIAQALQKKKVTQNTLHNCEKSGKLKITDNVFIHDDHPREFMSTAEILIYSSNICTYKVAKQLGKKSTYDTLKKFGFAKNKTILGLPGETKAKFSKWNKWKEIRFANISFGQGISVTGLEIIQAYSVFANGGYLVKPYIIQQIKNSSGQIIHPPTNTEKNQIISNATATIITKALRKVVTIGTGKSANSQKFTTAGKTGTAEKFDQIKKHYSKQKRIASFVGFAPAFDPHLVVYVVIDEPKEKPYYGGKWAAPVFKEIIDKTLTYLNVSPNIEPLAQQTSTKTTTL